MDKQEARDILKALNMVLVKECFLLSEETINMIFVPEIANLMANPDWMITEWGMSLEDLLAFLDQKISSHINMYTGGIEIENTNVLPGANLGIIELEGIEDFKLPKDLEAQ